MKRFDLGNGKLLVELQYNTRHKSDDVIFWKTAVQSAVWTTIDKEILENPENTPFKKCLYTLDTTMANTEIERLKNTYHYKVQSLGSKSVHWIYTSDRLLLNLDNLTQEQICTPITAAYFGDHDELFVVLRMINNGEVFCAPATMLKEVK